MLTERRRKRSQDPLIALHYHLAEVRAEVAFDAVVVADSSGLVLAGAGSWAVCEELAAYAPLMAENEALDRIPRLAALRGRVDATSVDIDGQQVFFCTRRSESGKSAVWGPLLERARQGVSRILSAA
jgi:hypothetical protein